METAEFTQLISERNASVVLERSGLSYEELLALLDVELVNANGAMRVDFAGADCNLTTATIEGLTTAPARYNSPLHPAAEEARLADSRS